MVSLFSISFYFVPNYRYAMPLTRDCRLMPDDVAIRLRRHCHDADIVYARLHERIAR